MAEFGETDEAAGRIDDAELARVTYLPKSLGDHSLEMRSMRSISRIVDRTGHDRTGLDVLGSLQRTWHGLATSLNLSSAKIGTRISRIKLSTPRLGQSRPTFGIGKRASRVPEEGIVAFL